MWERTTVDKGRLGSATRSDSHTDLTWFPDYCCSLLPVVIKLGTGGFDSQSHSRLDIP